MGTSSLYHVQRMKAPPVMVIKRILLYNLLGMLAQSNYQVYGVDTTDCPVEIQVQRHSKLKINVGTSLIIDCPVHYCKKKPVMQWCKLEVDKCVKLSEGKAEWNSNVFSLEVFSAHLNDSGLYRCRAIQNNFFSESHGIEVIVEEKSENIITVSPENTTSISEESQESGNYKILHIIYASASVGLCCPFIIICMFWWRYHAKQKRTALTQQRQEILVRNPEVAPFHAAGTTQASEESSSLYYCSMRSPLQALHGNTIYDNVPPWNAQSTAPNAPHTDSVTPSIPVLLENPDVLTYAAINHSASGERCQRRDLTVENEFTEYASINVNK